MYDGVVKGFGSAGVTGMWRDVEGVVKSFGSAGLMGMCRNVQGGEEQRAGLGMLESTPGSGNGNVYHTLN